MDQVRLFPAALEDLLNTPEGPAGEVIAELAQQAAAIARTAAPVMKPWNRSRWGKKFDPRYQYGPAGATKASVRWSGFRYNDRGGLYSGVNVNYGPTLFLEYPARQIHSAEYKFMTEALDGVQL